MRVPYDPRLNCAFTLQRTLKFSRFNGDVEVKISFSNAFVAEFTLSGCPKCRPVKSVCIHTSIDTNNFIIDVSSLHHPKNSLGDFIGSPKTSNRDSYGYHKCEDL